VHSCWVETIFSLSHTVASAIYSMFKARMEQLCLTLDLKKPLQQCQWALMFFWDRSESHDVSQNTSLRLLMDSNYGVM